MYKGALLMGHPVTYFEIAGKNVEDLIEFYSSVFDWKIQPAHSGSYGIDTQSEDGIPGHILAVTEDMGFSNMVSFYVEVEDLQSFLDKAGSLGGKTIVPPMDIPGNSGSFACFFDPSGNCIGLYRYPDSQE